MCQKWAGNALSGFPPFLEQKNCVKFLKLWKYLDELDHADKNFRKFSKY